MSCTRLGLHRHFYPRPPRGGRHNADYYLALADVISIHALREEGDANDDQFGGFRKWNFYPRPPRGGRHRAMKYNLKECYISIHALREEGDPS